MKGLNAFLNALVNIKLSWGQSSGGQLTEGQSSKGNSPGHSPWGNLPRVNLGPGKFFGGNHLEPSIRYRKGD